MLISSSSRRLFHAGFVILVSSQHHAGFPAGCGTDPAGVTGAENRGLVPFARLSRVGVARSIQSFCLP